MKSSSKFLAAATVVSLGVAANVTGSNAAVPDGMEKCYGVAAVGKNDCGTAKHSCAGQAGTNSCKGQLAGAKNSCKGHGPDPQEWVLLPEGTCGKLFFGSTERPKG